MAQIRISGMCSLWPWPWSYDLGSRHDPPLSHGQQLCEILSRSNMAVKSYDPDMDFVYDWTVNLALEIWPWVKVMTHPSAMDNNCEKYYLDPTWQWRVMARTHIFCYVCTLTLTLEVWPWIKVMTHLGYGQQLCEILSRSNMAVRSYGPDMEFGYVCTVTLALEVWPWVKVMTHHWVMDNKLCEISRSNIAVSSYGPDADFGYVCTVTLTLEIWPWVKVMTHPWVMDNNCVKYHPDWTRG